MARNSAAKMNGAKGMLFTFSRDNARRSKAQIPPRTQHHNCHEITDPYLEARGESAQKSLASPIPIADVASAKVMKMAAKPNITNISILE